MEADIEQILFSREQIEERVKELAAQVMGVYREKEVTVAVALNGAFVFAADLVRNLVEHVDIVFVRASSYGDGTESEGRVRVEISDDIDWSGRHVLLIEDIVDTGRTMKVLLETLQERGAATVRACAFLDKPARREVDVDVDFVGFVLEGPEFVVGYGLDLAGRYRNLPYVGTLRSELRGD
jgi:hypoxanthine phosphoribosyltransferase